MQSMIDPETALALVIQHAQRAEPESISAYDALGLALAESICADVDYPPFDRAMMDGFAVRVADAGHTLPVTGEVSAGGTVSTPLAIGSVIEIMTGAPCPAGTEAVVPVEDISRANDQVTLPTAIVQGQNIARRGSECAAGAAVLQTGDIVTPLGIASIVTFGIEQVRVFTKPKLAIITTGNELVTPAETPGPSQIRNSNGPMLSAMAQSLGVVPTLVTHARDTMDELAAALHMANHANVVVMTGAVSAGKYDSVPDALRENGATVIFHKVTQRPGKPIIFAVKGAQLFFGLPGNPLSCHLGFHRYVAPALRMHMGLEPKPALQRGRLAESFAVKGPRTVFQLAKARNVSGEWHIEAYRGKGSADMYTPAPANALLRFEPGTGTLDAGAEVVFEWLLM